MRYDVIIIGGGPAGYTAALEGAKRELNIAMIEEVKIGGVCLHEGCIPMKSMLHTAKVFRECKMRYCSEIEFDYALVNKEKEECQRSLEKSLNSMLKSKFISIFFGEAQIIERDIAGEFRIRISNEQILQGKNLIISSGSEPIEVNNIIYDKEREKPFVMSSGEFIKNPFCEGHTLIVGSGAVGLELADFIVMSGNSVTVIDEKDTILEEFDISIRSTYLFELKRKGIRFELGTRVKQIDQDNKTVLLEDYYSHEQRKNSFDRIVTAIGRRARKPKGLDKIGVEFSATKGIMTDARCKTNIANCYACGDVNDKSMLAHIAFEEGKNVILDIVGIGKGIDYDSMPHIIYTIPELSKTGLNSNSYGVHFQASSSLSYGSKYYIENRNENGTIILYFNKSEVIVGAQIMGTGASELIVFMEAAILNKMTMNDMKNFYYPHPSIAEAIKYIKINNTSYHDRN